MSTQVSLRPWAHSPGQPSCILRSAPRSMCPGFSVLPACQRGQCPCPTALGRLLNGSNFRLGCRVLRAQLAERHEHSQQSVPGQCPRECPQQQCQGCAFDDLRCVPVAWPASSPSQEYSLASWEAAPVGRPGGSRELNTHSSVWLHTCGLVLCSTDLLRPGSSRAGIGVGARSWLVVKSVLRGRMLPGQDSRHSFLSSFIPAAAVTGQLSWTAPGHFV